MLIYHSIAFSAMHQSPPTWRDNYRVSEYQAFFFFFFFSVLSSGRIISLDFSLSRTGLSIPPAGYRT